MIDRAKEKDEAKKQKEKRWRQRLMQLDPLSRKISKQVICAVDLETTGPLNLVKEENFRLDAAGRDKLIKIPRHEIIEVGIIRIDPETKETWPVLEQRVKPSVPVANEAFQVHGISEQELKQKPVFSAMASHLGGILKRADVVVMHMAKWDAAVINQQLKRAGVPGIGKKKLFCTVQLAERKGFKFAETGIDALCGSLGIIVEKQKRHTAIYDAYLTA